MARITPSKFYWETDPNILKGYWDCFVQNIPPSFQDPYYAPEFIRWNRWIEGGTPGAVYFKCNTGEVWYPFLMRNLPEEWGISGQDITSAYGFGGPLVIGDKPKTLEAFQPYWKRFCQENQVVAELIRFHPILKNYEDLLPYYTVNPAKEVVWIELEKSEETLWAELHPQKRRYLRKAEDLELVFTDALDYYGDFKTQYIDCMEAKHAKAFYLFQDSLFQTLQDALNSNQLWLHTVLHQGTPVSTALILVGGDYAHYFLVANTPEAKPLHSSAYLIWETAKKAKAHGCKKFFLGGGLAHHDSLFQFKRHFSPCTAPYLIGARVHNDEVYEALRLKVAEFKPLQEIPSGYLFFYRDIPIARR